MNSFESQQVRKLALLGSNVASTLDCINNATKSLLEGSIYATEKEMDVLQEAYNELSSVHKLLISKLQLPLQAHEKALKNRGYD